jgi:hypothetical protein
VSHYQYKIVVVESAKDLDQIMPPRSSLTPLGSVTMTVVRTESLEPELPGIFSVLALMTC